MKIYPYYDSCPGAMIYFISSSYPCLAHDGTSWFQGCLSHWGSAAFLVFMIWCMKFSGVKRTNEGFSHDVFGYSLRSIRMHTGCLYKSIHSLATMNVPSNFLKVLWECYESVLPTHTCSRILVLSWKVNCMNSLLSWTNRCGIWHTQFSYIWTKLRLKA